MKRRSSSEGGVALRAMRSRELLFVLVGVGVLLRVVQYASNRSLWIDEAWLALNLIEKPLSALAKPLDFNQAAPVGFLVIEGLVARSLGYAEYVLRIFPLLCGLVSVPAFAWLARRVVSEAAAPFALLLFAVANGVVYYSSEVKPYETDLAVAVVLLAAGVFLAEGAAGPSRTPLVVAVGGLILLSLSFPAVFVIAAVTGALLVRLLSNRQLRVQSPASLAVLLWVAGTTAVIAFGASRVPEVRRSFEIGSGRFLGVTGSSSPLHAANVMGTELAAAIGFAEHRPFNQIEKLALVCALIGAVALVRRNWTHASMLLVPFALLLGASAAHLYPIVERTELFLVPAVVLLIAEGIAQLVRWTPLRWRAVAALLLVGVVGSGPVWFAGERLVHPTVREEIRPVLEFIRDHWRPGDTLYVHYGAQYALLYYDECKCLRLSPPHSSRALWPLRPIHAQTQQFGQAAVATSRDVVIGGYFGFDRQAYVRDLDRVRNRPRVWFLYTHLGGSVDVSVVRDFLVPYLAAHGERIAAIDRTGAHAYLYRMRA
jgi:hypothetical protein